MKLVIVLAAVVALSASSAIPVIPGDNSHYVEGESRYIWIPDGEGVPQLVDLQAPIEQDMLTRNGANNQYWLYTRQNPISPQVIVYGNTNSISNSNYDGDLPLNVIVHGWNNNGNSEVNTLVTAAFLADQDCNVIVVDWSQLANGLYTVAVLGVPSVGQFIGNFLIWLFANAGGNWNNVHLVGHSLGAHIVGNAGRILGGRVARVTGLDPAGPLWYGNSDALEAGDGLYVEAIHTDGGSLGIFNPIAHANFYPNGGRNPQPGCLLSTCSHGRSYELYASSVRTNHFTANQCDNIGQVADNECTGSEFMMGNAIFDKNGSGIFGLVTGNEWPY